MNKPLDNHARSNRIYGVMEKYREYGADGNLNHNDKEECVTDILADLRHYCDENGVDFHQACDMSYQHYNAELTEEQT